MVSRRDKNLMSCARTSVSSSVDCPDSAVLSYEAQTPHSTHCEKCWQSFASRQKVLRDTKKIENFLLLILIFCRASREDEPQDESIVVPLILCSL